MGHRVLKFQLSADFQTFGEREVVELENPDDRLRLELAFQFQKVDSEVFTDL